MIFMLEYLMHCVDALKALIQQVPTARTLNDLLEGHGEKNLLKNQKQQQQKK